jgi:hypothetical protein
LWPKLKYDGKRQTGNYRQAQAGYPDLGGLQARTTGEVDHIGLGPLEAAFPDMELLFFNFIYRSARTASRLFSI